MRDTSTINPTSDVGTEPAAERPPSTRRPPPMLGIRLNPARRTAAGPQCLHRDDCHCRRPAIGRALVIAVGLELIMGLAAIATDAGLIGLVACASMAACIWSYALAEVVSFYRIGLPEPEPARIGRTRVVGGPHQQL